MHSNLTLVCFAVKEEAAPFRRLVSQCPEIQILLTGMGKANAEKAIRPWLTPNPPALVLSAGFAGGLRPDLRRGTVLFGPPPGPGLESALRAAGALPATFHCADRVAVTAGEKRSLRAETGADAVEMESQSICHLCRTFQVPAVTVRVILDTADQDLPLDFNALMTQDQRLDPWKLLLALAKSPATVGALLHFQKQTKTAARRMAQVLHEVLSRSKELSGT
jgi:adenosylhomocysteine nucleosidase